MSTRMDYSKAVLSGLGITPNWRHIGARRSIVAWAGAEDGWHEKLDGKDGAAFNLLNTTLFVTGCTSLPNYNVVPGVRNYATFLCGVKATVSTLQEPRYAALVAQLAKPFASGKSVLHAVADSEWGTFHNRDGSPNYPLADAIYDTYLNFRSEFNAVVVGS